MALHTIKIEKRNEIKNTKFRFDNRSYLSLSLIPLFFTALINSLPFVHLSALRALGTTKSPATCTLLHLKTLSRHHPNS